MVYNCSCRHVAPRSGYQRQRRILHGITSWAERKRTKLPSARRIANKSVRDLGFKQAGELIMTENVYKVIELVGTSSESWEKATAAAFSRAGKTLRDLRVAEVVKLDVQIKDGKVDAYRSRISVSF